ncbi:MAG: VOC family protein [Pseudomonadota bacterium]
MNNSFLVLYSPKHLIEDMIQFYEGKLGFYLASRSSSEIILKAPVPQTPNLSLRKTDRELTTTRTGLVFHVTNFDAAFSDLTDAGHAIPGSCDPDRHTFMIADPAGNQIEFRALSQS